MKFLLITLISHHPEPVTGEWLVAPAENMLAIAVEAGEKNPR